MKIAIMLSTFNGSKYLDKQLKSIADQTLISSIHLYIRDDGSSDNTLEIINSYRTKIDITVKKGANIGPANSFWDMFLDPEIKADYYAFCDQDDIWDSNKIEKGVLALCGNDRPMLWCSNCRVINENDQIIRNSYQEQEPIFLLSSQFVCGSIQGCAMIFNDKFRNKIALKRIKTFPMHDFVLITYAIADNEYIYDNVPSFSYRIHGKNVVAKDDKMSFKRIKKTFSKWCSTEHKNETTKYLKEFIEDKEICFDTEEYEFLNGLLNSRHSLSFRIKTISSPRCIANDRKALRSFKIRTMLGLI